MEVIVLYVNCKWFSFFGFWSRRVGMSYTNAKENVELWVTKDDIIIIIIIIILLRKYNPLYWSSIYVSMCKTKVH